MLQQEAVERQAGRYQGFCQPGQIMAAVGLLKQTKNPTDADIDAIENMCRCGAYGRIRQAITAAGAMMP